MAGFKSLKKTRRKQVLALSFAAIAGVLVLIAMVPDDAFQFFRSPSEVVASPPPQTELFRIGGMVQAGSIVRGEGTNITFVVTDCFAAVPVVFDDILPALFEEGQGMVGQGRYVNGTFEAVEILAKHDETYMPAEVENMHESQNYCEPVEDTANEATDGGATNG